VFRDRLITAAVLIPLVVAVIYWVSTPALAWILALIVLAGAWEWTALMGLSQSWQRLLYLALIGGLLVLEAPLRLQDDLLLPILLIVMLCWAVAVAWIIYLNRHGPVTPREMPVMLTAAMGIWLLLPTWLAILWMHGQPGAGPSWVLLLMLLVWGADGGAYFAGRKWGRHKLAVQVSPGKTWEGVSGGALLALIVVLPLTAWLIGTALPQIQLFWPSYLLLSLLTIAFSVSGDLLESVAKRRAGVKDSGHILPGHGGVLDRIDSLTAAAPCYSLGLLLLSSGGGA